MWQSQQIDFLDNKLACSASNRCISALIAGVLGLLVGGYLLLLPKYAELGKLKAQEKQSKERILYQVATVLSQKNSVEQEKVNQWLVNHRDLLLADTELATVLTSVNQLATQNRLEVNKLYWQEKQAGQPFVFIPLKLKLTGSYQSIGYFSEQLSRNSPLVNLYKTEWTISGETEGLLSFHAEGYGYFSQMQDSP